MLLRFFKKTYKIIAKINRRKIQKLNINKLSNSGYTILSQNCFGGRLYNDFKHQFLSPTINLYIEAEDFIVFLENLDIYLSSEVQEDTSKNEKYPVGILRSNIRNIKIYFVHYTSFDEAKRKWEERKLRINKKNLFVIATDRDGMNFKLLERFDKLPYRKVIFTHKEYLNIKSSCYIKGFENMNSVGDLWEFSSIKGNYLFEEHFDSVKFLNK